MMQSAQGVPIDGMTVLESPESLEKASSAKTLDNAPNESKLTGVGLIIQLLITAYAVIVLAVTLRRYSSPQQYPAFIWLFLACSATFYIILYNALSLEQAIRPWFYRHYPALRGSSILIAVLLAAFPFGALYLVCLDAANAAPSLPVKTTIAAAPSASLSPKEPSAAKPRERTGEPEHPILVLTNVEYQSDLSSTTVTIGVNENVEYDVNRLTNPDRIYLDFHGTKPEGYLLTQRFRVTDQLLRAVRVAEHKGNVTRVTLETNRFCDYLLTTVAKSRKLQIELLNSASGDSTSSPVLLSPIMSDPLIASSK